MTKKSLIINIILLVIFSSLSFFITKNITLKYYHYKKVCNYNYDARYRELENGYEEINAISEDGIPIAREIINHRLTDYVYCYSLGTTKDNKEIVAPYAKDIGCIYTNEVCKLLLDAETKLSEKTDISNCNK